jgi:lipopolysaccharide transport system ATP-binding protein
MTAMHGAATRVECEPAAADRADDVVLDVRGVSKKFSRDLRRSLWYGLRDILVDFCVGRSDTDRLRPTEFWALDDVSFCLPRGDSLGLIGRNGAGKTTLLRIIAGLIRPDRGEVRIRGRIAPLLALGAGFNPLLSGKENIFVNMAMLGLSSRQIRQRLDEVIAFAELEHAIAAPVGTYSSGMTARLGFSCAIHTDPEILLLDEVLAVGDITFRGKCYRKLAALRAQGTSLILVSHNAHSVLTMCRRGIHLEKGKCVFAGDMHDTMRHYEEALIGPAAAAPALLHRVRRATDTGLHIDEVFFRNGQGTRITRLTTGSQVALCVRVQADRDFEAIHLAIVFREAQGEGGTRLDFSGVHDQSAQPLPAGQAEIRLLLPCLALRPGSYLAKIAVCEKGMWQLDGIEAFPFQVHSGVTLAASTFYHPRQWELVRLSGRGAADDSALARAG